MFVRGSGSGQEYKRVDNNFYRGIVVKNNDPEKLNRVKVYIPELTNQPFDDWFDEYENININSMGINIKTEWNKKKENGDWTDTKMFEEISNFIPWAEQCFPLFGESGNFRYHNDSKISTITDGNYDRVWTYKKSEKEVGILSKSKRQSLFAFNINDSAAPGENNSDIMNSQVSTSPAFWYETEQYRVSDNFSVTTATWNVKGNPYAYQYAPSNNDNKSKGTFGIPQVGSKVWVFHYEGDLNFPIYFGVVGKSKRELSIMNNTDNPQSIGINYPMDFEN